MDGKSEELRDLQLVAEYRIRYIELREIIQALRRDKSMNF